MQRGIIGDGVTAQLRPAFCSNKAGLMKSQKHVGAKDTANLSIECAPQLRWALPPWPSKLLPDVAVATHQSPAFVVKTGHMMPQEMMAPKSMLQLTM